jgi:hypothetical protein
MRRPWFQIYEGLAIALVLFMAIGNTTFMVGAAIVLLLIGLAVFPAMRRTGTIAAAASLVAALLLAALVRGR